MTVSQVGYAIGLVTLLPLGDLADRRRLVTRMLVAAAVALAGAAAAPGFAFLAVALGLAAVMSVVAQVVVPLASTLAPDAERGRVVGVVMSGLLVGILTARTVSGLVAGLGGWRTMFAIGAALMLLLAAALWRSLPAGAPSTELSYGALLRSVPALVRHTPPLRARMVYGACGMAVFSVLWTALTLHLAERFGYGEAVIGLFGLAGIAGALSAQGAGRLYDAGHSRAATGGFWAAVLAGWGALLAGEGSVALIVLGIVVLDLGVQGQHILNQSTIFGLGEEVRSRVNTAYMASNFLWGAIGSGLAALAWTQGGWSAVCALGTAFSVAALAWWAFHVERT